jgi:lysozyme
MQASSALIAYILKNEGFSATAYPDGFDSDGNQLHSIGYGHQIQPNESYLLTATISRDTGMELFAPNLTDVQDYLNENATYPLAQWQYDELVDFGYNEGTGALQHILDTWNSTHDPVATTNRMSLYNKSKVNGVLAVNSDLVRRRADEVDGFLNGGVSSIKIPAGATTIAFGFGAIVLAYFLFS